jgi:hypothetical protein
MRFRVDDLIRNNITQEEGRVVRFVEKNDTVSRVVVLPPVLYAGKEKRWGGSTKPVTNSADAKEMAVDPREIRSASLFSAVNSEELDQ